MQGDLDTSVLVAGEEGNANFDKVTVRAVVETNATDEQFATLVAETERRCPVTQLFKRSSLEWDNEWTKAPGLPHQVDGRLDGAQAGRRHAGQVGYLDHRGEQGRRLERLAVLQVLQHRGLVIADPLGTG